MITMGLTGGIGAGKSEASEYLKRLGIPVLDTDVVARELVTPGQPALDEIVAAFGSAILDSQGLLDRSALGQKVFENSAARQRLEGILHPRIYEGMDRLDPRTIASRSAPLRSGDPIAL